MEFSRHVTIVQRRPLCVADSQAYLLPLLEPLFQIPTHMFFEERVQLFKLAFELPHGFVAGEIGSYLGASTAFVAAAASLKNGRVHAVDTWHNDAMNYEQDEDTFERFQENTRLFRHVISIHRGRAEQLKDEIPSLDLLFIDGDHSYAGAKANLTDYAPKLKSGSLLAIHDFNEEPVQRAVHDAFPPGVLADRGAVFSLQTFQVK